MVFCVIIISAEIFVKLTKLHWNAASTSSIHTEFTLADINNSATAAVKIFLVGPNQAASFWTDAANNSCSDALWELKQMPV